MRFNYLKNIIFNIIEREPSLEPTRIHSINMNNNNANRDKPHQIQV